MSNRPVCPGCETEFSGYCYSCESKDQKERTQGEPSGSLRDPSGLKEAERVIYEQFKRRGCFDPAQEVTDLLEDLRNAGFVLAATPPLDPLREALEAFTDPKAWEYVEGWIGGPDCPDGHQDAWIWLGAGSPIALAGDALAQPPSPPVAAPVNICECPCGCKRPADSLKSKRGKPAYKECDWCDSCMHAEDKTVHAQVAPVADPLGGVREGKYKSIRVTFESAEAVCRFIDGVFAIPDGKGIVVHLDEPAAPAESRETHKHSFGIGLDNVIGDCECGLKHSDLPSVKAPAPVEALDLPWIIRSLEQVAKPLGDSETGIARLLGLQTFIAKLKSMAFTSLSKPAPAGGREEAITRAKGALRKAFYLLSDAGKHQVAEDCNQAWMALKGENPQPKDGV